MPEPITADMIKAIYAEDIEQTAVLLVIESVGLEDSLFLTSHDGLVQGQDTRGLMSNGQLYAFIPFKFMPGGTGAGEPARSGKLEIASADGRIVRMVKAVSANAQPTLSAYTVRVAAPDVVETAFVNVTIRTARIAGGSTVITFVPRDFAGEPACKARYGQVRTPGLY